MSSTRPVALVTGVGRQAGIAAAVAVRLAAGGWDLALTHWAAYDDGMPWGRSGPDPERIAETARRAGARTLTVEADLAEVETPGRVLQAARDVLGPVTGLVMCHCESVDSGLLDTTVDSFDRHVAVNARATWLLVRAFAVQLPDEPAIGRIVALTSDATVGNLPYGASKGALDRIVIAAARELAGRGVTANVINPGPVDTGWMSDAQRLAFAAASPLGRLGLPQDAAALVAFLCSAEGGWINGQLLHSDGGLHA